MFRAKLAELGIHPDQRSVWIRSQIVNSWGKLALSDIEDFQGMPIQLIRSLAKQRLIEIIDPKVKRWPFNSSNKTSGILWNPEVKPVTVEVIKNGNGEPEKRIV